VSAITFGTDGWRAIIGDDFTYENVRAVAAATAAVFAEECGGDVAGKRLIVGYDARFEAAAFAAAAAEVLAAAGFEVLLSDRVIPTPGVCYGISRDDAAVGGIMLTASHNPSAWLGVKVRMADGGASPAEFTDRIEEKLQRRAAAPISLSSASTRVILTDLVASYLDGLRETLRILAPSTPPPPTTLTVIVDPLYGAGQGYLAQMIREQDVEVIEIHAERNPSFNGLHPEPIPPWTDVAKAAVLEHGAAAAFVTDGDGDRIGAIDEHGNFVSPHRIIALLAQHLAEDLGRDGRIIKTLAASTTIDRLGAELGIEVVTKPIGFKWIYEEMLAGDVLIGGEESGGIGIPEHVRERDGLLMALLLLQMMRVRQKTLGELVADFEKTVGMMYYLRRDLTLDEPTMERFRTEVLTSTPKKIAGQPVINVDRTDGLKLLFADDEWLLLRGSGTEPLVRVYAEATTPERLTAYLDAGEAYVRNESIS